MKKIVALVLATTALAIPATQANAAGPSAAQVKALQKQVKTLQAQVKALQKWVPTSCTANTCFNVKQLSSIADFTYTVQVCQQAILADEFQATWGVIDQISAATQSGKTYFGQQSSISDAQACSAVRITRPSANPPNANIFSSLVSLLTG